MKTSRSDKILAVLENSYSGAGTALQYETPFQLLVATMLSAQSTDKQVNKITSRLFQKYKEPRDFAVLKTNELEKEIKGVGLYRSKSKNIIEASRIILEKHSGQVPKDFDSLLELPGVGRKTANVVLSSAFDMDALAVDTHVHRVANRLGLAAANCPEKTEEALKKCITRDKWSQAHYWLISHGRLVCKAVNPRCSECKLFDFCKYAGNGNLREGS